MANSDIVACNDHEYSWMIIVNYSWWMLMIIDDSQWYLMIAKDV